MRLLYATTNAAKIQFMKKRVEPLGIELLCLSDIDAPAFYIKESGNSPLENAKIKALAYYDELKIPLFSCDSGLYIEGIDEAKQPGVNVRGKDDIMSDEETIAYYSSLATEFGGSMTAWYQNAIYLVLDKTRVFEYMGDDITSERFLLVSKPHEKRREGFPLDSLSVNIGTGKYYYDMDGYFEKYGETNNGFAAFFSRVIELSSD